MSLNGSPRILIARLSHIGDCILTLPLLCALRRRFPQAYIAWAVERPADQLLAGHQDLDDLIVVPRAWMKSFRAARTLRARLREQRFEMVFDPQSLTKSAALGWLSGASVRIGMARPHGRELAPWLNSQRITLRSKHLVDRTMELLRGIDHADSQIDFRLPVDSNANQFVIQSLSAHSSSKWIAINPGGLWRSKQWELDRYAAVAIHLQKQWQTSSIVTWAGQDERQMAERIAQLSNGSAIAAPQTDLRQLAALLARSLMFIGGDTGPMHIAAALGTPCIALFGTTRPEDSGPYGLGHERLQAWYQSGTCRQRRNADNLAMHDISVTEVCAAADRVMLRRANAKTLAA